MESIDKHLPGNPEEEKYFLQVQKKAIEGELSFSLKMFVGPFRTERDRQGYIELLDESTWEMIPITSEEIGKDWATVDPNVFLDNFGND